MSERNISRKRAYLLLGDLYLHGVLAEHLDIIQGIPALAEHAEPANDESWAAEHQRLLGFNVPPYASVFLEESGYLGGEVSSGVGRSFREGGFSVAGMGVTPDHLGDELTFLAFLCDKNIRYEQDGETEGQKRVEMHLAHFLWDHLLQWLPMFSETMQRQRNAFYQAMASLTLELIVDHAGSLPTPETTRKEIEDTAPIEGLRSLARFLTRPVACGFYLSREQIADIGRRIDVPTGFIEREQMMLNVLEASQRYEATEAFVKLLNEHIDSCRDYYRRMAPESCTEALEIKLRRAERVLESAILNNTPLE